MAREGRAGALSAEEVALDRDVFRAGASRAERADGL
jgi:hypothetical protein